MKLTELAEFNKGWFLGSFSLSMMDAGSIVCVKKKKDEIVSDKIIGDIPLISITEEAANFMKEYDLYSCHIYKKIKEGQIEWVNKSDNSVMKVSFYFPDGEKEGGKKIGSIVFSIVRYELDSREVYPLTLSTNYIKNLRRYVKAELK